MQPPTQPPVQPPVAQQFAPLAEDDTLAWARTAWDPTRAPRLHTRVVVLSAVAFALTYLLAFVAQGVHVTTALDGSSYPADWLRGGAQWMLMDLGASDVDSVGARVSGSGVTFLFVFLGLLTLLVRSRAKRSAWRPGWLAATTAALSGALTVMLLSLVLAASSRGWVAPVRALDEHVRGHFGAEADTLSGRAVLLPAALVLVLLLSLLWPSGRHGSSLAGRLGDGIRLGWRVAAVLLVAGVVLLAVEMSFDLDALTTESQVFWQDSQWGSALALTLRDVVTFAVLAVGGTHVFEMGSDRFALGDDLESSTGMLVDHLPWAVYLLPVLSFVLAVLVLLRFRLTRARSTSAVVELVVAGSVAVLLSFWLVHLVGVRSADYYTGARLGSTFLCLLLVLGLAVATVAAIGGRLVGWIPGVAARLGGRSTAPDWAAALVERLERDGRRVPKAVRARAELLATQDSPEDSAPDAAPLPRGVFTPVLALVLLAGSALLLVVPLDEEDVTSCASPWSAYRATDAALPVEEPPSHVRTELDSLTAQIATADEAVVAAKGKATRGADLWEKTNDARTVLNDATAEADDARVAFDEAQEEVDDLADVGSYQRDEVESAQEFYDEYSEYDDDGFWLENLEDARAAFHEAEEPLRDARAARDRARATRDTAVAAETAAQRTVTRLERKLAPHLSKLSAVTTAQNTLSELTTERSDLDDEWRAAFREQTVQVEQSNEQVALCRERATSRVWGAGILGALGLVLLASSAVTAVRRRRVTNA